MLSFSAVAALALKVVEDDFADAHALWSHLYVLVGLDVLECLFKGESYGHFFVLMGVWGACYSLDAKSCVFAGMQFLL
jgi:hypothetical protein